MLLAIDIGNSNVSIGVFKLTAKLPPELVTHFKISASQMSVDEYTAHITDFLSRSGICSYSHSNANENSIIDSAAVSSVVPSLTPILFEAAKKICGKKPFMVTSGIRTGFEMKIKNPEQLGADIVCNCTAALAIFNSPTVILDMGTATTLTVIDNKLTIIGTIIIPGLRVSLEALYNSAAQLNDITLDSNVELIGKDTRSAVGSGIINGNAFMIDGFVRNIREELGLTGSDTKLLLIATGSHSEYILPCLRNKFKYSEALTLMGLAVLYQKNNKI